VLEGELGVGTKSTDGVIAKIFQISLKNIYLWSSVYLFTKSYVVLSIRYIKETFTHILIDGSLIVQATF